MKPKRDTIAHRTQAARAVERARIRSAQRAPLRNLRGLLAHTECNSEDGWPGCGQGDKRRGRHTEDCTYGNLRDDIRALRAATRERGR